MNKKLINNIIILFVITLMLMQCEIFAVDASFSIDKTSINIEEGQTTTFNITANNCGGQFTISSSNQSVIKVSSAQEWIENNSKTITVEAVKSGTATITITAANVSTTDEKEITGSKQISVTVKAKETTPVTPSEPETPSKPETPSVEFKKVNNETVYATGSVRLRSSCTTSTSDNIVGALSKGTSVIKTGIATKTVNGILWSRIVYNGKTYYVSDEYLTTEKPETTEETTEETPNEEQPTEETPTEETPVEENPTEEETSKVFGLSKLEIKNSTLSPKFDLETYEYTIGIKEDISSLEIEAVANNENATVEIIGNENLQDGENVITILVTNAETGEVATYQIIVNKNTQKEGVAKVNWLQPSTWGTREKIIVGIIGALILLIVILIIVKIRLAKREDDDLDLPGADELDRALTEHQELTENEEIETIKQEEKSNADIEKPQEYFEKYSKRKGKHF